MAARRVAFALATALAGAALADGTRHVGASPNNQIPSDMQYQLAMEAYGHRRYQDMIQLLQLAARRGHLEAQETLALVLLDAEFFTAGTIRSDKCEAMKWMYVAWQGGSHMAKVGHALIHWRHRLTSPPLCR